MIDKTLLAAMIAAIRKDPNVGRGSCSVVDECFGDKSLAAELEDTGFVHTVKDALKWAYTEQELWLERGLNQRWGEDDDPQLKSWEEWKLRRDDWKKYKEDT